MAQVSYGTITITDTNDINRIYVEYCRSTSNQLSGTTVPNITVNWSESTPAWVDGEYIWQRAVIEKSGTLDKTHGTPVCLTGAQGETGDQGPQGPQGGTGAAGRSLTSTTTQYTTAATEASITQNNMGSYTWSNDVPDYNASAPAYWVRITNTYSNPSSTQYIIYKDNGITDAVKTSHDANTTAAAANTTANNANTLANTANNTANNANSKADQAVTNVNNLQTKLKYYWVNEVSHTNGTSGWTKPNYPAGTYAASGISGTTFDAEDSSTYGYNTWYANGINLRYNAIKLGELTGSSLIFYQPSTTNQGGKAMELNGTALRFYDATGQVTQATFGGSQATISGTIEAYDGYIGSNSTNRWYIGDYRDYSQTPSAVIKSLGTAFIQLGGSNTWRLSKDRIHTAWNDDSGSQAGRLHFLDYEGIDINSGGTTIYPNKYWDSGLHFPTSRTDKFLYIRNASTADYNLTNLTEDINDDNGYWQYRFYISADGSLYARNLYILDDRGNTTQIGGTDGVYLLKSGGTITGDLTVNGTLTGTLSGTATRVSKDLKIQLNGGTTEGTNQFTYNGSTAKTVNITKSSVGLSNVENTALSTWAGSANLTTTKVGTLAAAAVKGVDTSITSTSTSTNLPTSAAVATLVRGYLPLTGGNVTGAVTFGSSVSVDELTAGDLVVNGNASFTNNAQFNTINGVAVGSSPKFTDTVTTVTVTGSGNAVTSASASGGAVTLTKGTTFPTGTGTNGYLTKWTGTNTIGNGPALGSDTTKFLNNKGEWAVPAGTYTYTLPLAANGTRGGVQIGYTQSGKNYPVQLSSEKMYVNVPWENTTYSAGTGLTLNGTTFNHSNSVTAGTVGTSSATSGATLAVPYVTYDAQGHITGTGTHTHTVNGLSGDILTGGYINIHPENNPTIIPFMHNDIAHLLKRGGNAIITYNGTNQSVDLTNCFDGSGSYWSIANVNVSTIVIELTLHRTFTYGNTAYIDFGNVGWRAKAVKIEVMNSTYSNDTWTAKLNTTTNEAGHVTANVAHKPSGATDTGAGFNKIRFTFSDFASKSGSNINFRIAQLGIYNYGSAGLRETYMSRGSDDPIFRSITPYANNTYALGGSSNKWSNVYATTLTGTLDGPVKDIGNGTNTTFAYSKAGLDSTSWFAAWNGYELRAISPAKTKSTLSLSKSDVGLGNVLNFKQVTAIGQGANGTLRVWTGDPSSTSTNDYTDVAVTITAYEQSSVQKAEALNLSAAVGNTNKPVYFKVDGKPYAISYTIDKSVPSDAKFTDTTYTAGSGLTLDGTQFKHSNSVTAGTVSDGGSTRTLAFGGTFKIPSVTYDAQGHISSTTTITLTMPAAPSSTTNATNDSDGNPINTTYVKVNGSNKMTGNLIIRKAGTGANDWASRESNPSLIFEATDGQTAGFVYTQYDSVQSPDSVTLVGSQTGTYFIAPNIKATGSFYGNLSGTATTANRLAQNTEITYAWNGINYFNISAANQSAAKVNDTPHASAVWTHILRFNHANSTGYYTDLAVPFNENGIFYKRICGGSLQNSTTNGGWVRVVDVLGTTMVGALNFANNTYNKVGDDAQFGDINQAGKIGIKGINGATGIQFVPYSGSTGQTISIDGAGTMSITSNVSVANNLSSVWYNSYRWYANQNPNWWYRYSTTFTTSTVPTTNWCVRVQLNCTWDPHLKPCVCMANYSNRAGVLYYEIDSHLSQDKWRAYLTNYSSNFVSTKRVMESVTIDGNSVNRMVLYFELAKPTEYNGSTPNGSFTIYSPVPIDSVTSVEIPTGMTALGFGENLHGTNITITSGSLIGQATLDGSGNTITSTYVNKGGDTMTGTLALQPASGEGGQIELRASAANTTQAGIILDQYGSTFRIFGIASADGATKTGTGTPLVIDPYGKTITGGYTITGTLSGNASTATTLQTTRTIFGKNFNGSGNVAGQALVYGSYTATASARYAYGGIQVREQDLVGNTQSDILYAPTIGFHWSGRIAASLIFHSDGNFYLRKQDGVTRATLDANLNGNAATATKATQDGNGNTITAKYVTIDTNQTITASQKTFNGATRWSVSGSATGSKYGACQYDSTLDALVFSFGTI